MATITRKSLSAVAVASLLAAGTFFGAGAVLNSRRRCTG